MLSWLRKPKAPASAYIDPPGRQIEVKPGETLLQAALAADIPFPHNCRVGSCTTCKCRLVSGHIKALTDTSYVLSAEDLRAGYILACQSLVKDDVQIALDRLDEAAPIHTVKHVLGAINAVQPLTHDILEIKVDLDEPISYTAGQYAEVSAPEMTPRNYSFACAPGHPEQTTVSFYIRHVLGGEFTDWLFGANRIGTRVKISAPYGSFWLRPDSAPILCVAGGSGMAPIKAILEQAQRNNCKREVLYLFGARTERDLYCLTELDQLRRDWAGRFRFIPILSQEPTDTRWQGERGLVTELLATTDFDLANCHAYLCGPPPMIDSAIDYLITSGTNRTDIHFDKFLDRSHTINQAKAVNI